MVALLRAVVGAAHIGPTLLVTLVTVLLAVISGLDPMRVLAVGAMMATNQLSVGWSNDALDYARDIDAGRDDKPVVRGDVTPRLLMTLAVIAAMFAVGISVLMGPALAIAHLVALAAGWAYNAGLKGTLAATACYMIFFGLIPTLATLARADPQPAAWWATATAALLGLAAHFANVLPDLDDDLRHGIRALPHRLGVRVSAAVALVALAVGGVISALGPPAGSPLTALGASATLVLLVAGIVVLVRAPRSRALFRIIMLAALAALVTLSGAAGAIVG